MVSLVPGSSGSATPRTMFVTFDVDLTVRFGERHARDVALPVEQTMFACPQLLVGLSIAVAHRRLFYHLFHRPVEVEGHEVGRYVDGSISRFAE